MLILIYLLYFINLCFIIDLYLLLLENVFTTFLFFIPDYLVCSSQSENQTSKIKGGGKMEIKSSAFKEGEIIPGKYTCDSFDISPPLAWSEVPDGTKTFALICDDPDAPMGTWVHWVLFNLPGNILELSENVPKLEVLKNMARQGKNDFRKIGYGGPCPPGGTHRYYFKIYALDKELDSKPGITKKELLKVMEGHILATGQLMGKYKRF
jgi:Raf kinase inhibitor-like protein, YbhB/YbcL family